MEFEQLPTNLLQFGFKTKGCNETPLSKEKVERVAEWIAPRFEKSDKLNKDQSSYGLKHTVEKNMKEYIANGELIAAMLLLGFKYKEDAPNAYFYLDKSSVKPFIISNPLIS